MMAGLDREFGAEVAEKAERIRLGMELKRRGEPEYVAEWPSDDITSEVAVLESYNPQRFNNFFDCVNGSNIFGCAKPLIERAPVVLASADTDAYSWINYGAFAEDNKDNFIAMYLHTDTRYPSLELFIRREDSYAICDGPTTSQDLQRLVSASSLVSVEVPAWTEQKSE